MGILNKKLVDDAASDYSIGAYGAPPITCSETEYNNGVEDFIAGVNFAEPQLKALAMGFAEYYYSQSCDNNPGEVEYWFNEFIKD